MVAWHGCRSCTGGCTPGIRQLLAWWDRSTGLGDKGCYNCRQVRGGSSRSVHSCGRAGDLACNAFDPAQKALGDAAAAYLVKNAEALGIQLIIWNRHVIGPGRYGWRPYTKGSNAHTDHLHVEMTPAAAAHGNHALLRGSGLGQGDEELTPELRDWIHFQAHEKFEWLRNEVRALHEQQHEWLMNNIHTRFDPVVTAVFGPRNKGWTRWYDEKDKRWRFKILDHSQTLQGKLDEALRRLDELEAVVGGSPTGTYGATVTFDLERHDQ